MEKQEQAENAEETTCFSRLSKEVKIIAAGTSTTEDHSPPDGGYPAYRILGPSRTLLAIHNNHTPSGTNRCSMGYLLPTKHRDRFC